MSNYKVTIWGSRGSFTQTSIDKMKYGLDTSCISLETKEEIFLIDCGSGIRNFDTYYCENNLYHKKINLFLTHYHHDHINGLGYVDFIFHPSVEIEIFGLGDVYGRLKGYYDAPYFPIPLMELPNIKTRDIEANMHLKFGNLEIITIMLNHPQQSLGYKFIAEDKAFSIVTDYEYKVDEDKEAVEAFIKNSDYLIIDSCFTSDDYIEGWGHNDMEDVCKLVKRLNVGECFLFHHNKEYNDNRMDELQFKIAKEYHNIRFAFDNMGFEVC